LNAAQQIVDAILGGGDYAKRLALRGVRNKPPKVCEIRFGFGIRTASELEIIENAREDGVSLTTRERAVTKRRWDKLAEDIWYLEQNALEVLRHNGFYCRSEGHSDEELIGSVWMSTQGNQGHPNKPNDKALEILREFIDSGEPYRTSSGSISWLDKHEKLYTKVSRMGRRWIDVDIYFFDLDKIKKELERYDDYVKGASFNEED
jgi:hypothetical protein